MAGDAQGRPSFQPLQPRGSQPQHRIAYYAFDLLHLDGADLTGKPLHGRRATLPALLDGFGLSCTCSER